MNNLKEYRARINRAIDYIELNIDQPLSLDKVAEAASFSKFHFHRLFTALVGESPNSFIQRIRVEKAATLLLLNKEKSVTEIALDLGFSSSSSFARLFKELCGMSASEWRLRNSNIGKTISNNRKDSNSEVFYFDSNKVHGTGPELSNTLRRLIMELNVKVEDFDEMLVAYVRHIGPYQGDAELFGELFGKLFKWAGPRGLLNNPEVKILSVYHDNPEITDDDKLRTSVCLTVPDNTEVSGDVGKMTVPGGKYAVAYFRLNQDEYGEAWNSVYGQWLPESGYQPDDRPSFEMYLNDPEKDPEGKCEVNICVPVIPLQ